MATGEEILWDKGGGKGLEPTTVEDANYYYHSHVKWAEDHLNQ